MTKNLFTLFTLFTPLRKNNDNKAWGVNMGCKQRKQKNAVDATPESAAPIAPNADAIGHRQCGSYASANPEISKFGWGGPRPNGGGARKGAGRKPKSALAQERIAASIRSINRPAADGARWYCVAVVPHMATEALGELVKQGFTAWTPRVDQPGHGSTPPRRLALFPGYLFVRFSLTYDPWWQINGTPGVRGLFPIAGEKPWPVPKAEMTRLFDACDAEGVYTKNLVERPEMVLEVGENVMVADGPFTSFPAKVLDATAEMVRLEITIFGRSVEVEYPHRMVEKAR